MTDRQLWAKRRNWLLFRIRGMSSVFTGYNRNFVASLLPEDGMYLVDQAVDNIDEIIKLISESKYKGGN